MENKIELKFFTLMAGHTHGSYNLVLQEIDGTRKIPIIVGTFEAQSIATEIEGIVPQRPLTHDLIISILRELDVELKEVVIYDLQNGVFFARLELLKGGIGSTVDARTSDAIAIALRAKAPIYIESRLMKEIGVEEKDMLQTEEEEESPSIPSSGGNDYSQYNKDQLQRMLQDAVESEDYIKAALIRDELQRRK
jgi:bifunctional DNase/RNase